MIDDQDDEYYDDEEEGEEGYEEEEEGGKAAAPAESGGKGPIIFAVVAAVLAIGVVAVAIKFLTGDGKDESAEVGDLEGGTPAAADATAAAGDGAAADAGTVELGASFDFDSILGATPAAGGEAAAGGAAAGAAGAAAGGTAASSGYTGPSGGSSGSAGGSSGSSSGSSGSSGGSSGSSGGSSSSAVTNDRSGSGGSGSGSYKEGQIIGDSTPAAKKEESTPAAKKEESTPAAKKEESTPAAKKEESTPAAKKEESTPAAKKEESTPAAKKEESTPAPKKEETASAASESTSMDYEKATLASLGSKASSGSLSTAELGHLQSVPADHPNYTQAWAGVMANAEAKRDYKAHCAATDKIMEKPGNRYHPEYNLEKAKCQMRNNDLAGAIESVDRTVGNSYDMNPSSKTARLLLAYEIKARCRTKLYDDNAKANAGLGDEGKLNSAIQSWSEFKNYAAGIGNQAALQKCEREIADLEARRAG